MVPCCFYNIFFFNQVLESRRLPSAIMVEISRPSPKENRQGMRLKFLGLLYQMTKTLVFKHLNLFFHSPRGQDSKTKMSKAMPSLEALGENPSLPLLDSGGCRHPLTLGLITPISTSIFPSPSG